MWKIKSLEKPLMLLFLLCLFPLGALAQSVVRGTVQDETGEPVIGATISVQGANAGAITDLNGNFQIQVAPNATLNISSVGYVPQSIKVSGRTTIQIVLQEDNTTLNDVVVIGYGTQKKKLITGATVQVKGEEIAKLNTTNALEAMQSQT
ncbi:MAG: carboxypeptidase-like regulatory domain-containing protein, partial [Bacteroidales bacterium]|nr:carboxypeptidase-like regulatory domain-containing protein [Bacteroidales bacterium]